MASKSRGGLSKRELAASQKMKLTKKVSTPRSTASKASSSTPVGAIGQNKDGSFIYDKSTPNYTPANANYSSIGGYSGQSSPTGKIVTPKKTSSSSKSSSSSSSSKSNKSKVSGLVRSALGVNTANASDGELNYTPANQSNRGLASTLANTSLNAAKRFATSGNPTFGGVIQSAIGAGADYLAGSNPTIDSGYKDGYEQTGTGKGIQMFNEAAGSLFGNDRLIGKDFGLTEKLGINDFLRKSPQEQANSVLGISSTQASGLPGDQQPNTNPAPWMDTEADTEKVYQDKLKNDTVVSPQALGASTGGSLGGGSLGSGTSLAPATDPSTDSYIKDLQKSTEGDFGAKDATKQIKDLIRSLDPEYDAYLKQAQTELDKSKTEDLNKLAGVFAGYNTADSEQRLQQQERVQGDYATQLTNLLAKLQLQKQKDVTGYKSQLSERLQNIAQAKSTAQQRVAELIQAAQDKAWDRNYKMKALSQRGRAGSDANSYIDGAKELQIQLSNLRGEDGFIDPQDYLDAQTAFLTDYPQSASKFSSIFPVENYLSPIERISKGLQ